MFKRLLPYFKYLKPVKIKFLLGIAFGIVYSIASGLGLPAIIDNVFPILFGNAVEAPSWIINIANTFFDGKVEGGFLYSVACLFPQ